MIRNYIKIAWRNFVKRKTNGLINVFGLASGMAVCLLLMLFIRDEKGYDDFQENKDRVYRVALDRIYPGRTTSYAMIPANIGEAIATEFPEVEQCTRIFSNRGFGNSYIKIGEQVFEEKEVILADSNFFQVFSGVSLGGNLTTALEKPNSVVLNETTAKRYFGSAAAALGKSLDLDQNHLVVTGVCKDWPSHSHFDFSLLLSRITFIPANTPKNYINFSAHTYLLLKPTASPEKLEAKLPLMVKKYVSPEIEKNFSQSYEQFSSSGNGYHYFLQSLPTIHLQSNLEAELKVNGSEKTVSLFLLIAIFILVIACINFINLSTARSVERAREVGIRKTFGSERSSLVLQFLYEAVLICFISLTAALLFVFALIPFLNSLTGKELSIRDIFQPLTLLIIVVVTLLTGILAGLYPALVLSSFKPIKVLKGKLQTGSHGTRLRNALVVFQFAISVILIISTIVVNLQMKYMTGNDLGFKKDLVLTLERTDMLGDDPVAFKNDLLRINGVQAISGNSALPGTSNYFGMSFQKEGTNETHTGRGLMADENYASVLGLEVVKGRFFSKEFGTDTLSIILNESAVAEIGLGADPIGARLTTPDEQLNTPGTTERNVYTVAGVVKDFHYQNLHEKIAPLYIINVRKFTKSDPLIAVKLKTDNFGASIKGIEEVWKKYVKDRPLHYDFLDQKLAEMYTTEENTRKLFSIFSMLAIIIACMGLLGLIAYTIQLRFREIGIRKVLGATIPNILWLLGKNFLVIVIISSLIAFPIAWWAMSQWLKNFAYRIDIPWWVFILAAVIALVIAVVNISFQAIKAAMMNPVKSLRTE